MPCNSSDNKSRQISQDKKLTKLSKPDDKNLDDRAWRVRKVLEIFNKNALQFTFFSTALSIYEMMVKFHGKTILLQYMKDKPNSEGFLFCSDIYCGKGSNIYSADKEVKLSKCALGM